MRRITLFLSLSCFLILLTQKTEAQVGINLGYQINQTDGWVYDPGTERTTMVANGYYVGLDYWFRLKDKRIEFLPEIGYSSAVQVSRDEQLQYRTSWLSFQFNTNIYLLDLLNDCNCPTFSKQTDFFKKGFFVRIAPGLARLEMTDARPMLAARQASERSIVPFIAAGLGLDIGISDLITITPILNARYFPEVEWIGPVTGELPDTNILDNLQGQQTDFWQFTPTLRLGLRFDDY